MSDENKTLTPVWICYVDGRCEENYLLLSDDF